MKQSVTATKMSARASRAEKVCATLAKLFPRPKIALNYSNDWELLVAVILSAQCTDKKVNEVTEKLFKKYKNISEYANADKKKFENAVRSTGFYKNKAKNIIASAKIIQKTHHGKIPQTMSELVELPGVARKTANIILSEAFGKIEGIAVDTHVIRLSKLLRLTAHVDPIKIERDLIPIIPKKDWYKFSLRLIEYGRKYCPAKKHNHASCPISKVL